MLNTDILVVGGGPAGATAARYLSNAGVKNILIQRNFNFKKPCGGGLRFDAFDEFEIDNKIIKKYVDKIALIHKDTRVEIDIKETPLGIVDRVEFDTYLRNKAVESGTILYEAVFVSLELFDEYVISTIKKDDEFIQIRSNYVIAADGVNSKIRKQVNGDNVNANMTNYTDLISVNYSVCEFHFGEEIAERYYAWAFPHASGSNVGTLADGKQEYMKNFLKVLDIKEESKILGYKIPNFKENVFYKNRVFFVGDSASQVLPFTYEGIYYAMASAKLLANVLIKKKDPVMYEQEWNKKYYKKFATLLKLQNLFLKNNFMIRIMMRLYQSKSVQREMVMYWMDKREVDFNARFLFNIFKHIVTKK